MTATGDDDDDNLVEQVAGAYRPRPLDGLRYHPAWHDLDAAGRIRAHEVATAMRPLEAALDRDGRSPTVRAVLARIARRT
jgi:hypothetical protein